MNQPALIIVTGPPGAGKTTLARHLTQALRLPLFSRDTLKELLYDNLGAGDNEWRRRLGAATYPLLYAIAEQILIAGHSCLLETAFSAELDTPEFKRLNKLVDFQFIQIVCRAEPAILHERVTQRFNNGQHPAHPGAMSFEDYQSRFLTDREYVINLPGKIIEVITNDTSQHQLVLEQLRHLLK